MSEDMVKVAGELKAAAASLNEKSAGYDALHCASKTAIEKLEKKLDAQEIENQKLVAAKAADEKKDQERAAMLTAKIDILEKQVCRSGGSSSEKEDTFGVFKKALVHGAKSLDERELKTLRTDINSDGGFLVQRPEIAAELIRDVTEVSDMRGFSRVVTTSGTSYVELLESGKPTVQMVGELESATESQQSFGQREYSLNDMEVKTSASRKAIQHVRNIANEVVRSSVEKMAQFEGNLFLNGSGVKGPEGLLVNSEIDTITSASSLTVVASDLFDLTASITQSQYLRNSRLFLNMATLNTIRKFTGTTNDATLFEAGNMAAGMPSTINGFEYIIMQDMPGTGVADNLAIGFGDLSQGYIIVDGETLNVHRDDSNASKVTWTMYRGIAGGVRQPEAIKLLKIKA